MSKKPDARMQTTIASMTALGQMTPKGFLLETSTQKQMLEKLRQIKHGNLTKKEILKKYWPHARLIEGRPGVMRNPQKPM